MSYQTDKFTVYLMAYAPDGTLLSGGKDAEPSKRGAKITFNITSASSGGAIGTLPPSAYPIEQLSPTTFTSRVCPAVGADYKYIWATYEHDYYKTVNSSDSHNGLLYASRGLNQEQQHSISPGCPGTDNVKYLFAQFTSVKGEGTGSIQVRTIPPGAWVSLDGVDTRQTTVDDNTGQNRGIVVLTGITIGSHTVQVGKTGYVSSQNLPVTVSSGGISTVDSTLIQSTVGGRVTINVTANVSGCYVYCDGILVIDSNGSPILAGPGKSVGIYYLYPKDHVVKVTRSGYYDYVTTISAACCPEGTFSVNASLTPISPDPEPTNNIPVISYIYPDTQVAGSPSFLLDVYGSNFTPEDTVFVDGNWRTTTYDYSSNGNHLKARIFQNDMTYPAELDIAVYNWDIPSWSNTKILTINQTPPTPQPQSPTITNISPSSVQEDGGEFVLTVYGANYTSNSKVYWNDSARPTSYVSSSQLKSTIYASDIYNYGTASISVYNSDGSKSNSQPFTITQVYVPPTGTPVSLCVVWENPRFWLNIDNGNSYYPTSPARISLSPGNHMFTFSDENYSGFTVTRTFNVRNRPTSNGMQVIFVKPDSLTSGSG